MPLYFWAPCRNGQKGVFILKNNSIELNQAAAEGCWGMGNEDTVTYLFNQFGNDYCIISIGQAGEQLMTAAGIAVTDAEGNPFRLAARGGVGCGHGFKRFKSHSHSTPNQMVTQLNKEARSKITAFNKHVAVSDRVKVLRDYGTASTCNARSNI